MHEMSLMEGIFEALHKSIEPYPGARVIKVNLVVGALTNAVPDALEFAFEAFSKGTRAEGAQLEIELVPLTIKCGQCNWEGPGEVTQFECPKCQSWQLEIVTGRELLIKSLEVETNGD